MNTQNVNIKTTTQKPSEQWGSDPEARLDCVIAKQCLYLTQSYQVWNLQLSQKDEAEEVLRLLSLVSDDVHKKGVLCRERSYPLVSFYVAQPQLQAKDHTIHLYGVTEREAWKVTRKDLCNNTNLSQAMMRLEEY